MCIERHEAFRSIFLAGLGKNEDFDPVHASIANVYHRFTGSFSVSMVRSVYLGISTHGRVM